MEMEMEGAPARRRLAILSSHFPPITTETQHQPQCSSGVLASKCASSQIGEHQEENDCVFCKIVRGQGPALKVGIRDRLQLLDNFEDSKGHGSSLIGS